MYAGGGSMKDPYYAPVTSWTGFYVGLNGGGTWADVDVKGKYSFSNDGGTGGAQFGYNWQRGHVVFGFEVDAGGMDIGSSKTVAGFTTSVESAFYADATARLGYSFDRVLVYAKGGAAIYEGSVKTGASTNTGDYWGATIGGGVEYLLSPTWSIKAEYQYFDFGSQDTFSAGTKYENDLTVSTAKVGINLHFPPKDGSLK
jgi:outer membrane immunogenic protein